VSVEVKTCECGCRRPTKPTKDGFRRFVHGHNGAPLQPRRIKSLADRFWPKVDKNGPVHPVLQTPCWLWTASLDGKGYGQINAGRCPVRMLRAHRVAYELLVETVPQTLDLDHLCRNTICVNPEHLEPVTRQVNLLRGETNTRRNAEVTHCPQGHPYSGSNLKYTRDGKHRYCAACNREKARKRKETQIQI